MLDIAHFGDLFGVRGVPDLPHTHLQVAACNNIPNVLNFMCVCKTNSEYFLRQVRPSVRPYVRLSVSLTRALRLPLEKFS